MSTDKSAGKDAGMDAGTDEPVAEPVVLSAKPASQVEGERLGAEADEYMREANLSREARTEDEISEHAARAQAQHEKNNPRPDDGTGTDPGVTGHG